MTVLELALKLMLFIVVGYVARKIKVMQDGFDKMLTKFVMAIPLPCMIINSFNIEFDVERLINTPTIILMSVGSMAAVYVVLHLLTLKMKNADMRKTVRFALMFTNFTFMGLPIVSELYGAEAVFNYVIFTLPIRIIFYGGAPLILGRGEKLDVKETLKKFICEPVVAVFIGFILYAFQIKLPGVITGVIQGLGNMASPLGLILCGSIIADANWSGITKYPSVFVVVIARLFIVPTAVLGAFLLIGIDKQTVQSVIFYYAMPVASFLPSFLLRYNSEAVEARVAGGYMVVLSTVACIATIPLWTLLLEHI
ncbi:MAG: AEC family transporter [Oscillospiraceae bacterium]|nr:AEC family transporter [Oscillospiraceae bacterium]